MKNMINLELKPGDESIKDQIDGVVQLARMEKRDAHTEMILEDMECSLKKTIKLRHLELKLRILVEVGILLLIFWNTISEIVRIKTG